MMSRALQPLVVLGLTAVALAASGRPAGAQEPPAPPPVAVGDPGSATNPIPLAPFENPGGATPSVDGLGQPLIDTASGLPCEVAQRRVPVDITLRTTPPVAGFRFVIDGTPVETLADGSLHFRTLQACGFQNRITVDEPVQPLDERSRLRFRRFYVRDAGAPVVTVTTDTEYRVSFDFSDLGSEDPVGRDTLDRVEVRSSTGVRTELPPGETELWLVGQRVVSSAVGPEVRPVYHTIDVVEVGGNSVVNRSQVKFFPSEARAVEVPLLFFEANIRARDAFFNFALGSSVDVEFPNGEVRTYPLEDGRLTLPQLARGDYLMLVDAPGLDIARPVTMSRDQEVDLKVISYYDLGAVAATGLTFCVGLLLIGRRRRRASGTVTAPLPADCGGGARSGPEHARARALVHRSERTALDQALALRNEAARLLASAEEQAARIRDEAAAEAGELRRANHADAAEGAATPGDDVTSCKHEVSRVLAGPGER
jgi:hypothetical protein